MKKILIIIVILFPTIVSYSQRYDMIYEKSLHVDIEEYSKRISRDLNDTNRQWTDIFNQIQFKELLSFEIDGRYYVVSYDTLIDIKFWGDLMWDGSREVWLWVFNGKNWNKASTKPLNVDHSEGKRYFPYRDDFEAWSWSNGGKWKYDNTYDPATIKLHENGDVELQVLFFQWIRPTGKDRRTIFHNYKTYYLKPVNDWKFEIVYDKNSTIY